MSKRELMSIGAAVLFALSAPVAAVAQTANAKALVDAAKAAGIVGEQADGFLGWVTPSSDAALKAAVQEINTGRAALYREAAQRNGVTVEAAGAATYTAVVQTRLKPGEFYKPANGGWTRK
jgi:uncharacterized protein YdbL (DUF1318 family)